MQQYMINNEQIVQDRILLNEDDLFHIFKVMRMQENDQIICANYETKEKFLCFVDEYKHIIIKEKIDANNELAHDVILAFALVSNDKFELVMQKACELGATKLIPFISQHSQVKYDEKKIAKKYVRFNKIIKEAAEQSKRNTLMELAKPIKFKDLVNVDIKQRVIAYENEKGHTLSDVYDKEDIMIVIGSEGGFAQHEVDYLIENNFKSVSLAKSILRCETAAIAALAIINELMESSD